MSQQNEDLVEFLNQELSNFSVLYIKLHRYHWFIQGNMFFELHQKFEDWYEETAKAIDVAAERILSIHGRPLATMSMFLKKATIREAEADDEPSEMLRVLHDNFKQISGELSEGRKLCDALDDAVTADLLTQWQAKLEKYQWMLRSVLTEKEFVSIPETVRI